MKSSDVIDLLRAHYSKEMGFIFLEQVANSNGSVRRYADAIVMNVWRSRFQIIGIEVKVSRSDWLSELKNPAKADLMHQYCDLWFVATPEGIIKAGELPVGWGHLECRNGKVYCEVHSSKNEHRTLDDFFVSCLLRRFMEQATPAADLERQLRAAEQRGFESGKESSAIDRKYQQQELERLKKCMAEFQNASGIDMQAGWAGGDRIGQAVRMVMTGRHMKVRNWLTEAKDMIEKILNDPDDKIV